MTSNQSDEANPATCDAPEDKRQLLLQVAGWLIPVSLDGEAAHRWSVDFVSTYSFLGKFLGQFR